MMFRCLLGAAMAVALSSWAPALHAQLTVPAAAAVAAASAASSPPSAKPGRRVLTPTEKRESSSMPGDLRPEDRVTPQIVVPLRKGASAQAERPATRAASTPAGINDTAARCEAQASREARERCRSQAGGASK